MTVEPLLLVAGEDPSGIYLISPWLMGLGAGALFGWIAHRYYRNRNWWGTGGAVLGVLLTALAVGLGDATAVPYSEPQRLLHLVRALAVVTIVVGITGALIFLNLERERKRTSSIPARPGPASP